MAFAFVVLTAPAFAAAPPATSKEAPVRLSEWAGKYEGGLHWIVSELSLTADGRYTHNVSCSHGGDVGTLSQASGMVTTVDGWFRLRMTKQSGECKFADNYDLYPMKIGPRHFLLDDDELTFIVNAINESGYHNADSSPRRGPPGDNNHFIMFDAATPLPQKFRSRILPQPLVGSVVRVDNVVRETVDIPGYLKGSTRGTKARVKVTLDIGSNHGVFPGMWLQTSKGHVIVEKLSATTSEAMYPPHYRVRPSVGMPVWSSNKLARVPLKNGKETILVDECVQRGGSIKRAGSNDELRCRLKRSK